MRYFYFGFMFYFAVSACTHNKLQGTWKTECTPLGRHASVSEVVFEGNHFKSNGYLFERKGCAVNTVHAQMNGTYSIDSKENFNYTPLTFKLSLLKNDVVEYMNAWASVLEKQMLEEIQLPRFKINYSRIKNQVF